jgi:hypothetical protein
VRAALISIAETPTPVGGKSLARRQLDFALAAGCERIIALGNGASPEAIALRHTAEARGARFHSIGDTHGLLGAVPAADELLVQAPRLLAEDPRALEALERGSAVLVLPAGPGVAAGFERIDLERAWGGALVLPGRLVERLADLPADSDATAALLRIALQARVAEKRLPEQALAEGTWTIVGERADTASLQQAWLGRNLPRGDGLSAGRRLAGIGLRRFAIPLLARPRALTGLWSATVLALGAAVAAAALAWPAAGFVLAALGALLAEFALGLARLRDAPFGVPGRDRLGRLVPALVDGALTACAALAVGGGWLHRLFPALVLLAALHASRPERWPHLAAVLGDRALLALAFALAAGFGLAEPVIMLAGLLVLALDATVFRARSRITPV